MIEFVSNFSKKNFKDQKAIFVGVNGMLYSKKYASPIIPFEKVQSNLKIKSIYQYQSDLLFVGLDAVPSIEWLESEGFQFYPTKLFLTMHADLSIQPVLFKAFHILGWDLSTRYCAKCGARLENERSLPQKKCQQCGQIFFPKLSPAVMVLVHRGREVLLARSPHFKKGVYGAIAGFVDIAESAEEAAHREVKEEVGLEIQSLSYFGTQSWPFPDSFMIAFHAEYKSGELVIDEQELEDAAWFDINHLPDLPSSTSISSKLFFDFIQKLG